MPLAVLILGRDVLLGMAAIYYRYISLPPPKTFARYWDFSLPSAEVRPTGISKVNTVLQLFLVGWTMSKMAFGADISILGSQQALEAMWYAIRSFLECSHTFLIPVQYRYIVGSTTIWSGASYIYTKDAVKILGSEDKEKRQQP